MKMTTERVIDVGGVSMIATGVSEAGNPLLRAQVGSDRVTIEMTEDDAINTAHALLFAALSLRQAKLAAAAAAQVSPILAVDALGVPK